MRNLQKVVVITTLLVLGLAARAEMVRDLYAAQVPVADQSSGTLESASRNALAQVLVKVSGSSDVLRNPTISGAMREARQQVLQYAYLRDDSGEAELVARFEFDRDWIVNLLGRAGEPLWTANRPLVLVWLVAEDSRGRYFVNTDTSPELAEQLLAAFDRRGVPARLPLFDLADSTSLSADEAWRLNGPALLSAAERYDVENFVAGRMVASSSGGATGDWSYFYTGSRVDRTLTTDNAGDFFSRGVDIVAEEMAARYAVAPSQVSSGGVLLSVRGVDRYADYANIVAWLEGLELIDRANVELISGDLLRLRLEAGAGAAQLASIIELNQRLTPIPPTSPDVQLSYLWQE